jgi:diphthamide synthase (EF-2-diphthine--ammonia ligase)
MKLKAQGFSQVASGDLFLEDLRTYRQELYAKDGLETIFPIWGLDTRALIEDFIGRGFKAIIVAVNESKLHPSFCGRIIDETFLHDLPRDVDPCGENGEYHSFVFDGPGFAAPVAFRKGAVVQHEYPAPKTADDCFTQPQPAVRFSFLELTAN